MPTINDTDNSHLDLSDDEGFNELLRRRDELSEIVKAGQVAYRERVDLDAKIIDMMGNSKSATAAGDLVITVETQARKEYTALQ